MKQLVLLASLFFVTACSVDKRADSAPLDKTFASPGNEYKPWVYWFWNNSNLTEEGITGDLEAMHRAGIGGVLIMEVNQNAPQGTVDFLGDEWRRLYTCMLKEAARLGIEVNMNNDAGWNGSGGTWIKPEHSMQVLTFAAVSLDNSQTEPVKLSEPPKKMDYYKDIAVFAFPTPEGAEALKQLSPNNHRRSTKSTPVVVTQNDVVDLTGKMAADGTLDWKVPEGKWTILRIGHTSKGQDVHPAPTSGVGPQCDVLSVEASEIAFEGQIGRLVAENRANTGQTKTFVATHIDSWEVGSQNWTPLMREEFKKYAGYDIWKFLPVFYGYVVDSPETTDRFLWDFRRAIAKMCMNNHIETFVNLSHKNGLRFSAEAYDSTPADFLEYAALTDEPMGEFWVSSNASWASNEGSRLEDCRGMASAGHVYGKNIVGAEAFTAADQERWMRHPGNIKILGDRIFSEGVNRFVFHRYSFQPWNNVAPGMMMGPWGLHYERTNTWWEQSKNYHEYLTRCQYMLRQGNYVADIAYIQTEDSPQNYNNNYTRGAYQWDQVAAHAVYQMKVKDGKFTMPSGASYSVLVLPDNDRMTLDLAKKLKELIKAGGTVVGYKQPVGTFGLKDSDKDVADIAGTFWSSVIVGKTPEEILAGKGIKPTFVADKKVNWLHRVTGNEDIFFVANPTNAETLVTATFGTQGGAPELYYPESGKIIAAPVYSDNKVALPLGAMESVFVVFSKKQSDADPVVAIAFDGKPVVDLLNPVVPPATKPDIQIRKATYHDKDATEAVKKILAAGTTDISVMAITKAIGDPAVGVVKTLTIEYTLDGKELSASAIDGLTILLLTNGAAPVAVCPVDICPDNGLVFRQSGKYDLTLASGKKIEKTVALTAPVSLATGWSVTFPAKDNTFTKILDTLSSWSDNDDEAVKYFSGTATYKNTFQNLNRKPEERVFLDLGKIEVVAEVKLNGKDIGTFWQTSTKPDVTDYLTDGENTIEIAVTNLWVNRLIGDASLPDVAERKQNGRLSAWPQWLLEGKPDPTGRQTFCMWNLWKKDETPVTSGLIGPVKWELGIKN